MPRSKSATAKHQSKTSGRTPPSAARPVPPDAVRVWRGFRLGTLTPQDFLTDLGTIFIPVTAQLQRLYGLTAYLPTVLPTSKPEGVPDEIALVFYESQQAYTDTSSIVAGRAYSLLHRTVFAFPASQTGFPILFQSTANLGQPYHLFTGAVDWQQGYAQVFVGARAPSVMPQKFLSQLRSFFAQQQTYPAKGLDGAVFCIAADWVLYWEHWVSEAASLKGQISDLAKLAHRVLLQPYVAQPIDPALTAHSPGLSGVEGKSMNIIFPR
jgi:hypothetical protein